MKNIQRYAAFALLSAVLGSAAAQEPMHGHPGLAVGRSVVDATNRLDAPYLRRVLAAHHQHEPRQLAAALAELRRQHGALHVLEASGLPSVTVLNLGDSSNHSVADLVVLMDTRTPGNAQDIVLIPEAQAVLARNTN